MRNNWKTVKLGELFSFKNGLNKGVEFFGKGTPIVNYMDVNKRTYLCKGDFTGLVQVTPAEIVNCGAKKGDVFFTRTSETLDEIGFASVLLDDIKDCVFSGYVLRARPLNSELLPKYCAYSLRTHPIRKEIMRKSSMTTRALTNGRFLSDVEYSYPSKADQQDIVTVLEVWDEYLEKLDKKIELKMNIKKGLIQQLLTAKKRLPGFNDNWNYVSIGSLGSVVTGNTPPKNEPDNYGGEYLWATAEDFVNKYIEKTNVTLSSKGESRARTVPAGSILVTCIASIGKNAIAKRTLAMNQQLNAITVSDKYDNEFFYYQIGHSKNELLKAAGSGAMPMLNKNEFSKIKLFAPTDKAEQTAIASLLSAADLEIDLLQGCRALIDNQRRFLLNNLVSGRIRTPENLTMPTKEVQYA